MLLPGLDLLHNVWEESKYRITHTRYDTNQEIANLGQHSKVKGQKIIILNKE